MKYNKVFSAALIGTLAAAALAMPGQATAGDSIKDRVSSYADKLDLSKGRSNLKAKRTKVTKKKFSKTKITKTKLSKKKYGKLPKAKGAIKGFKKPKLAKGKPKLSVKSAVRKLRKGNLDIAGRSISECSLYKWRWEKTGRYHWKERYERCIH